MGDANLDRNLLFGVIALQDDLIDQRQLAEACTVWALRMHEPLADLLIERGWVTLEDRREIERKLHRKVKKHGGDAHATLGALAGAEIRDAIRMVDHPRIRQSLSSLPPLAGYVLTETLVKPTEQRSRYALTRLHAEGGLGRVWVARDGDLNREVALKELQPERASHPEAWQRFLKEAQITGQLEHPGIVPVYELARRPEDDQPFYTMRLVRGCTLREAIAQHKRLCAEKTEDTLDRLKLLQAFVSVCQAVAYAHSRGVIHRDLKPENVVLGGFGEVVVLDWGLAKIVDQPDDQSDSGRQMELTDEARTQATCAGTQLGTPAYMAPEQAEGRLDLVDVLTDVYGLGTILFEVLTGSAPHEGTNTADVLREIATGETPRARHVDLSVPPALDAVCARAMARDRRERYPSAPELAEEVQRWIADEPVRAWREPWSGRLSRWARRNRSWVAAAAGTSVLVSAVAIVSAILIDGARRQAQKSLAAETVARADAGRRLDQARESIDTLLTGVGEGLAQVPGAQKVRRQLLDKAAAQYRALANEQGDDPALRFESGSAYARLGDIHGLLGDNPAAESDFRAAETILAGIAGSGNDSKVILVLGQVRRGIGIALENRGRLLEAEQAFRRAIDDGMALVQAAPGDAKASYLSGNAREILARLLTDSSRLDEAEALFRLAIADLQVAARSGEYRPRDRLAAVLNTYAALLKKISRAEESEANYRSSIAVASETVRLFPDEFAARSQLASSQRNLATLLETEGRSAEAEGLHLASLAERDALASANPGVPEYRFFRASSRTHISEFYKNLSRYREAEVAIRSAVADFQALVRDNPRDPEYRNRLGHARSSFGDLLTRLGRYAEAEAECRLANNEHRAIWDASPTNLRYGANLGNGLNNHARVLRRLGRIDQAEAVFRECLEVHERLAKDEPTVPSHRDMLALVSNNLAGLYAQRRQFALALPLARRAVAGYETLTRDHPTALDYAEGSVMSRNTLGEVLANLGSNAEAHNVLTATRTAAQRLVASHPDISLYLERLIMTNCLLAAVDASLDRFDEAIATLNGSSRLLREMVARHPDSSALRAMAWELATQHAEILLKRGRSAEAAAVLDSMKDQPCPQGALYYNVACLYSRAAKMTAENSQAEAEPVRTGPTCDDRAQVYADRAVATLRQAVAKGFRETSQFAHDADLDPLRSRPDFRLLKMDLDFPADPFRK